MGVATSKGSSAAGGVARSAGGAATAVVSSASSAPASTSAGVPHPVPTLLVPPVVDAAALGVSLHVAIAAGNVSEALRLVVSGADVNAAGGDVVGEKAFAAACRHRLSDVALAIVASATFDPNAPVSSDGSRPLVVAGGVGLASVVAALLERGADVNAVDKWEGHKCAAAGANCTL